VKLIQEYKCIEKILEHLDGKKYHIPEDLLYKEARRFFHDPEVDMTIDWTVATFYIHVAINYITIECSQMDFTR
jgi:5'-3' exonuclease